MEKEYVVFGKKVVKHLLQTAPNMVREIWIEVGKEKEWVIPEHITKKTFSAKQLSTVAEENHQGIVAFMKEYNYTPFSEMAEHDKILVLDRIQDPHNFGAIIRSAALFGYRHLVMLDHNQCPVTPTVAKTSAGTLFDVQIAKVSNLANALKALQENNHWVYATYLSDDAADLNTVTFAERNVILVGNEGDGVGQKIANQADYRIKIKTDDVIDSLNVSVATGVILFFATLNS